jgi:hypothetical protein
VPTSVVSQLIVDVTDRVVMPPFRRLPPAELAEKAPRRRLRRPSPAPITETAAPDDQSPLCMNT